MFSEAYFDNRDSQQLLCLSYYYFSPEQTVAHLDMLHFEK